MVTRDFPACASNILRTVMPATRSPWGEQPPENDSKAIGRFYGYREDVLFED